MPKLEVNGVEINYHLDGDGEETIVFLNGIMMSSESWAYLVPLLTEKNDYNLLRLDFRDQGLSDKFTKNYDVSIHVNDLKVLFDKLGLEKVYLLGVSYGAMVAMLFALEHPEYLSGLILANAVGKASKYLQAVSDIWEQAALYNSGKLFFKFCMPFIYSDDFYNRNWEWLKERGEFFDKVFTKEWFESFIRLSQSSKEFDIMDRLGEIKIPTLLIAATRDVITPVYEMREVQARINDSRMIIIEGAGHASFYEKMAEFNAAVLGFLALFKN